MLAKDLQDFRMKHNLNYREFAEMLGINRITLYYYETGKRNIGKKMQNHIEELLANGFQTIKCKTTYMLPYTFDKLRRDMGLSVKKLAHRMDLSPKAINQYQNAVRPIPEHSALALLYIYSHWQRFGEFITLDFKQLPENADPDELHYQHAQIMAKMGRKID